MSQWYDARGASVNTGGYSSRSVFSAGSLPFSAFGNETMLLMRHGRSGLLANVGAHLAIAIGAVWLGRACIGMLTR